MKEGNRLQTGPYPTRQRAPAWLPILAACMFVTGYRPGSAHADTPSDFLVQEVCDDGTGNGHTNMDPFLCPQSARKLHIGETLPYHKWDTPSPSNPMTTSQAGQISDSFPIGDLFGGRIRVIQTEYFDSFGPNFDIPIYKASRTDPSGHYGGAYDAIGGDGYYFNIMVTTDTGGGWQPIWSSSPPSCSLQDSWLLFPTSGGPDSFDSDAMSNDTINPQCDQDSGNNQTLSHYTFYPNLAYTSGKQLDTIKTFHFSGKTYNDTQPDQMAGIEMFYFTKQYGKTRWEHWVDSALNSTPNDFIVKYKCPNVPDGGRETFGGTVYTLQDCHDWSNIVSTSSVGTGAEWDPAANWHVDPLINSYNILVNTHLQCTDNAGNPGTCGDNTHTCQTVAPWNRSPDLNWGFDSNPQNMSPSNQNCAWLISIADSFSGQAIYQVQSIPSGTYVYTYGAAMWNARDASNLQAAIAVFEYDQSGNYVTGHSVAASNITSTVTYHSGSFVSSPQTTSIIFAVYPQTTNGVFEFTESWLSRQP